MPNLETSAGNQYDVDFAWAPTIDGACMIRLQDARRLPLIAAEFDGLTEITYTDAAAMRAYTWAGYTRLISAVRSDAGVTLKLTREQTP